jgi:glycosyltransferase involved in cell wall biosynthesis
MKPSLSIIIPAKNESDGLAIILPDLCKLYADAEIIIVDDGSTDDTLTLCGNFPVKVVSHKYSMGNGAAIKSGARVANGEVLVFMDADGQHRPDQVQQLTDRITEGFDMVVGTRTNSAHASPLRLSANKVYNQLASWITAQKIPDLTSGFRAVNASKFREYLHLLPNGFSYPTTITMAFFRAGYSVAYVPVNVLSRVGSSHIRPLRDGTRFLLIIFKIGTLYSPLKFFAPMSFLLFMTGLLYYLYVYFTQGRFTNMSALLFTTSILVFFIGIVSEQLTMLYYRDKQ